MSREEFASLLVRQRDVEADRQAAALFRAPVAGLHHAAAPAGDHRPTALAKQASRLARRRVRGMVLADPRRAEHRDGRTVDQGDTLEALAELVRDHLDLALEIVWPRFEEPAVVHQKSRGTCV
jgi:hypothetical protein